MNYYWVFYFHTNRQFMRLCNNTFHADKIKNIIKMHIVIVKMLINLIT